PRIGNIGQRLDRIIDSECGGNKLPMIAYLVAALLPLVPELGISSFIERQCEQKHSANTEIR
ncbi:hypothetical protein L9G16_21060, partial [Shewanella sp. A25]|nr:hypothetical protein [Shewanella shenzhenensis]